MIARLLAARLIDLVVILFGVSVVVFALIRLVPGDAVAIMLGANAEVTAERIAELRARLGLDLPVHAQYLRWARAALEQKTQVVVFVGTRATVVLPDEDVELGPLAPGDSISVGRVGARWEARVKRAAPT